MPKKYKYNINHIDDVHQIMNLTDSHKKASILKAGFADASLYYVTLKRLGLKEIIGYKKRVSFL